MVFFFERRIHPLMLACFAEASALRGCKVVRRLRAASLYSPIQWHNRSASRYSTKTAFHPLPTKHALKQRGRVKEVTEDGICLVERMTDLCVMDVVVFPDCERRGIVLTLHVDHAKVAIIGEGEPAVGEDVLLTSNAKLVVETSGHFGQVRTVDEIVDVGINDPRSTLVSMQPKAVMPHSRYTDLTLHTGLNAVDVCLSPVLGERLLFGGDSTSLKDVALDLIINQKSLHQKAAKVQEGAFNALPPVHCIYVSLRSERNLESLVEELSEHGAMEYTCVIDGGSCSRPVHAYLAPFLAVAMGEHNRSLGHHTLVVIDDAVSFAAAHTKLQESITDGNLLAHEAGQFPLSALDEPELESDFDIEEHMMSLFARLMDRSSKPTQKGGASEGSFTMLCLSELDSHIRVTKQHNELQLEILKRKRRQGNKPPKNLRSQLQTFRALRQLCDSAMLLSRQKNYSDEVLQSFGYPAGKRKRSQKTDEKWFGYDNYPPVLPSLNILPLDQSSKGGSLPSLHTNAVNALRKQLLQCIRKVEDLLQAPDDVHIPLQNPNAHKMSTYLYKIKHTREKLPVNLQQMDVMLSGGRNATSIAPKDPASMKIIVRGHVIARFFQQQPRTCVSLCEQIVIMHMCLEGYLDELPFEAAVVDACMERILEVYRSDELHEIRFQTEHLVAGAQARAERDRNQPSVQHDFILENILTDVLPVLARKAGMHLIRRR